MRDVAQVHDGTRCKTNIVRTQSARPLVTMLKAAALDARYRGREAALPRIQATLPPELESAFLFDQSLFVRAAIDGVVHEA